MCLGLLPEPFPQTMATQTTYQSTRVCTFYLRNACAHGDTCRFLHPPSLPTQDATVCLHFLRGNCRFGDRCRDMHPFSLSSPKPPSSLSPHMAVLLQPPMGEYVPNLVACRYFIQGFCSRGDACKFSHIPPKSPAPDEESKSSPSGTVLLVLYQNIFLISVAPFGKLRGIMHNNSN